MNATAYPKRLIEVDLPIKRISAHARREKSIRHGHISTLHIWWARRPLAACRAVLCAALWPDPGDELCPESFKKKARELMGKWAKNSFTLMSPESSGRFIKIQKNPSLLQNNEELRGALLDFIADFANWDNSTKTEYLETCRALTEASHVGLGGEPGTRPLVVDPFAGGGSIPLEALRVGADAFASDLNPVAVLLNKVVLEYIPKYGKRLAEEVRKWGMWIKEQAEKELAEFYPKDPDGATPIAYLWARTIKCEGPGCGAEVPLMRSLWLAKKGNRSVALQIIPNKHEKRVDFEIIEKGTSGWVRAANRLEFVKNPTFDGTVRRGSATCPCCGYTTPVASVRTQLRARRGGAADARLFCVVTTRPGQQGRVYRLPTQRDLDAVKKAVAELERRKKAHKGPLSLVPDEPTPQGGGSGAGRAFSQRHYGMDTFADLFTPRQALALTTLVSSLHELSRSIVGGKVRNFSLAVKACLALALDRHADQQSSLVTWLNTLEAVSHTFVRQALPIAWDFCEPNTIASSGANFWGAVNWVANVIENEAFSYSYNAQVHMTSATYSPLPDDSCDCFFSDPPYYDAVPYADLSDYFYVWLRRSLNEDGSSIFLNRLTPKSDECIVDEIKQKDKAYFENTMGKALADGRRVLSPDAIGAIVFAHKTTSGWESQLSAMINAGWIITASWPIDTERSVRLRAQDSAALASSIHLACRPRENPDGSLRTDDVGEWRDVLQELPKRIHEWMPRLAAEGVVGADAIFACLGPALEVFSRYSRVEKANGEQVTLKEYLEHVWAAVSKEALNMIFEGADATGFEEDARLTAMWLWTLSTGANGKDDSVEDEEEEADEEEGGKSGKGKMTGFILEYDAARKIAQGLGAYMEKIPSLVEIKGDKAKLLPVSERSRYLFGKEGGAVSTEKRKRKAVQLSLFEEQKADSEDVFTFEGEKAVAGRTVLDRVHQSMLLFSAGRGEALKRFLVEDGVGNDGRYWRLAQALSALYPSHTEEKRWVDGVLARKKGLGF